MATGIAACMLLFAPPAEAQRRIHLVENPAQSVGLKPTVQPKYAPAPLQAPANASYKQEDILIQEDFSRMTSGTEDHPDTLNCIASETSGPGIYVNPGLTSQPGWAGDDVYQAGGAAFLRTYNIMKPAKLMTPLGDYSGEVTVTCRAKALPAVTQIVDAMGELTWGTLTGSSLNITANIGGYTNSVEAETDDGGGSSTRLYEGQGWTRITYTFKNYSAENDGFICFGTEGAVVIDDIEITTSPTIMGKPGGVRITDYQPTQFTIEWQPVRKAFSYYLDLYKRVYTSDSDVTCTQDFENFEPSGDWASTSSTIVDGEGKDDSKALMLGNGDTLVTPYNGSKYKNMLFWMKVVYPEGTTYEEMTGNVYLDAQTDDGWRDYSWFYGSGFAEEYDYFDVDMNVETSGRFGGNYYAIRFRPVDFPEGTKIYIDAFEIPTGRPSVLEFVGGTDVSVDHGFGDPYTVYDYTEETTYTFRNLDPEAEYYYGVRSHYTTTFSDINLIHAFAVAAPKVLPATNVDSRGAMTANWERAPKATRYAVNLYGVYEAEGREDGYVILEENFDKIDASVTGNTDITNPESLGNLSETPLDDYTVLPGWTGRDNIVVQGMLGCNMVFDALNTVTLPQLYVGNGSEVGITLKAYGTPGDMLMLNVGGQEYALSFTQVEGEDYGCFEGTLDVPVTDKSVTPYFYAYQPFLIDEIKVVQDLNAGDKVYTWLQMEETDAETFSMDFSGLTDYATYAYNVVAYQDLDGETAASRPSDHVVVDLATGEQEIASGIEMEDATTGAGPEVVARYSLDGRRLTALQRGVNILKMSDGSTRKVIVK